MKNEKTYIEKICQLTAELEASKSYFQKILKNTCSYYENMLALMPGHVYWCNTENVYLGCNDIQAKSIGLESPKDIIGKTNYDLLPFAQAKQLDQNNLEIMRLGIPTSKIEYAVMERGEGVYFSQKAPMFDEDGSVIGLLGISIDITELKNAEKELILAKEAAEAANDAKTQFIANMSHDIRTPLSGVVGLSKLLEESFVSQEQKQYAKWINESAEELLTLLNGVLELASSDSLNEYMFRDEIFDLRQSLNDIAKLEWPTLKLKSLDFFLHIDSTIPKKILGDRTKLHRVILNLLGNAIKFTEKGQISLEVRLLEENNETIKIEFAVRDTGIGIPPELEKKVFDRFFRADPSYHGIYTGYGIGLNVAESYVNFLGGKIKLNSKLGVGTTFSFELWFKTIPDESPLEAESPFFDQAKTEYRPFTGTVDAHILLVEDNFIALRVIEMMVKRIGARFVSVLTASDALKAVYQHRFDLIFTDIGLPDFSGYELTRKIRFWEKQSQLKPMPIIGLTAHALNFAEEESFNSGMNEVFCKPLHFKMIQDIVDRYLKKDAQSDGLQMNGAQAQTEKSLGLDLPATEAELFNLRSYPIFDLEQALQSAGSLLVLQDLLQLMVSQEISADKMLLEKAFLNKDWATIDVLAHKMKGGALYCGTVKLRYASQYLERYYKSGHVRSLDELYQQLIQVIEETSQSLVDWLQENTQ